MPAISLAELRQNPAPALEAVEHGQTLTITRYRRPIANLTPAARTQVSGTDVMRLLSSTPVDEQWAAQLEADRAADQGPDFWERP